ncbi:NAD(P)/FAD-dependent oxidoreductase [Christiangramia sp. SM2212]|uniref:NAD(P)/FAD-dependent oxidoreductase n=1 Tax=Christiangramia sediminicola TaxID=3073267 RepID=A0ABU1ELF4_9FLAO|nr:NAD(P)/FAD-dependent oxidoreductase [Christiangramia sp. SM2212]MDR5589215.1 NAD(P)/FAD-dependent oxidoreductase [Christiangramia sp. SM2212]
MDTYDILIVGGGAAGFFTAINAAEFNPKLKILILERGKEVLTKVKVSGGGRCNVTHAEFIPAELVKRYPRGEKELRGPFHKFMTGDTIGWFGQRGIELKTEEDGRMFPITDSSQTIIDCFQKECKRLNIEILKGQSLKNLKKENDRWLIETTNDSFSTEKLMLATGSNSKIWNLLEKIGHRIVPAVPSLFTFNIKDKRIKGLAGISSEAEVKILGENLESSGPLLITHWGMSGPGILKLSAWGARQLNDLNYNFSIEVNWIPGNTSTDILEELKELKFSNSKQQVSTRPQFDLPKRLWHSIVEASGINTETKWADLNKVQLINLAEELTTAKFMVEGKSTFKEEFVTAGGIDLKEVDFKTFESKILKNLYFAGEILNIDAITGGFNFQNAWTGGYLAAKAMSSNAISQN